MKIVNFLIEDAESKKGEVADAIRYFSISVFLSLIGTYFVIIGLYSDLLNKKIEARLVEQGQSFHKEKKQNPQPIEVPPPLVIFCLPASLLPTQQGK
ncbi:hypothetical protein [Burkholderia glumae]|uniref:hypothetical protein n=1 Tax=Burkholderia glumae TaxID=337 RepID=UPI0012FDA85E|nr:hypothetical protein [Burkholderia glumae]QHE11516.1 hypothetical protein GQR88_14545 [Burkholderia glumae AU6208]